MIFCSGYHGEFTTQRLDKGFPCIALGIIGPSEACIITGYRENGDVLLGWNFFQDAVEFASQVTFDQSGYFITSKWWENDSTIAVISMGEIIRQPISTIKILECNQDYDRADKQKRRKNICKGYCCL
jgi:hypothetical protein